MTKRIIGKAIINRLKEIRPSLVVSFDATSALVAFRRGNSQHRAEVGFAGQDDVVGMMGYLTSRPSNDPELRRSGHHRRR